MKYLLYFFVLSTLISGAAFAEGELSETDCLASAESNTRQGKNVIQIDEKPAVSKEGVVRQ